MANLAFGIDVNENAKENGYDLYSTTLKKTLGAVYEDTWKFNPISSIIRSYELSSTQKRAREEDEPLISRDELNNKYSDLGLVFDQDEPQSVVDIIVDRKESERRRQSIIQRGPQGFLPGTLKFLTGLGTSVLDPINIGVSFIPVFGQLRFQRLARSVGFNKARFVRGTVEGSVGAAVVEPFIYSAAQKEQADYDLADSFLNIGFGTLFGGGLHVGAGKLKDIKTIKDFKRKVRKARENLGIKSTEEPEIDLYKIYYPENADTMMKLDKAKPETKKALLAKAVGDVLSEEQVDVRKTAEIDPNLRTTDEVVPEKINTNTQFSNPDKVELDTLEKNIGNERNVSKQVDLDNEALEIQVNEIRTRQKELGIIDDPEVKSTQDEIDEVSTRERDINNIIVDAINCVNGK